MSIAQQNLDAFLATQLLLIATLYTQLADIVARLVVVILLDVGRRHLSHVAQHVGGKGILVLSYAAPLDIEAGEAEHLFLEHREVVV